MQTEGVEAMSLLAQMLQQTQISKTQDTAASMQSKIDHLEYKVEAQGRLLHELVTRLEKRLGEDLEMEATNTEF